jgi:hypothetical protein
MIIILKYNFFSVLYIIHVEKMVDIMNTNLDRLEPINFSKYKKTRDFDSRFPMLLGVADDVRTKIYVKQIIRQSIS